MRVLFVIALVLAARPVRAERVVHHAIAARTIGAWHASVDPRTGVAVALWGSHLDVPGASSDARVAERAALAFVAAHPEVGAGGTFAIARDVVDGALRTVVLQQTSAGRPVIGAQVLCVFGRDRLFAVESHALPNVIAPAGGTSVLPLEENGAIAFHAVNVATEDHFDVYRAPDGRELLRLDQRVYNTGTLKLDVGERYATGVRVAAPAPQLDITVNGTATATGSDGTFSWSSGTGTVVPSVQGALVEVVDASGSGAPVASLSVPNGGSATWSAATDEVGDAQLSTYIYGTTAKARARVINPAVASWLDTRMTFSVNEPGACNAFTNSDGTAVHFVRATADCQNTGRIADIVYHEFGHALHYKSYVGGSPATDLSEGLADFNAANITEDPAIGRGFFYTDEPERDIDPPGREYEYPRDVIGDDPHQTGLIISGALWDLRAALVRALGHAAGVSATENIFKGVLQRAADIPSTYMAALVADDDDADLSNGTPHYCAIERAFGRHGLAPGFMDTDVATPVVDGLNISVAVTPPAASDCPASTITAIRVTWHAGDGVPATFDLAPGATWTGSFPQMPPGTVVGYTVEALRDDGTSIVFPQNAADPEYQLFAGPAIPIYCQSMDTDPMWNQTGNYGMEWSWAAPNGMGGDPSAAHTGTNVVGTTVGGDGLYPGTTSTWIETPAIDVSAYAQVHLQYWRWLTVEDRTYDKATISVNGQLAWQNAISRQKTLTHTDREWRFQDVDLTPYIGGGTAQVRWTLDSDTSNQFGGWNLDDVCLVALIKYPACGDGVVDPGEQCDDGNTTSGDGCSKTCIDEPEAGGGGCNAGGASGWLLCCAALARARGRRNRSRRASRSTCADRADRRRS